MRIGFMFACFIMILIAGLFKGPVWVIALMGAFAFMGGWAISRKLDDIRKSLQVIGGLMIKARKDSQEREM